MRFFVSLIAILGGFCSVCQRQRNKKPIKLKKKTKKVILFQTSLAALGLALIICRSKLMAPLRQYGPTMLQCCQCVAFWAGLALGPMFLSPEYTLLNALISSAFGYLVNRQYPPLTKDQKKWDTLNSDNQTEDHSISTNGKSWPNNKSNKPPLRTEK